MKLHEFTVTENGPDLSVYVNGQPFTIRNSEDYNAMALHVRDRDLTFYYSLRAGEEAFRRRQSNGAVGNGPKRGILGLATMLTEKWRQRKYGV